MKTLKRIWSLSVKIAAAVFTIITTLLSFFSIEDYNISNCCKIISLLGICIFIVIIACIRIFTAKKRRIWSKNSGSIIVRYGDLLKIAFKKNNCCKSKDKKFVVIPVNTHFDVLVQEPSDNPHPLVSSKTLHGRWLKKYFQETNKSPEELQSDIYSYLDGLNEKYEMDEIHSGGKRKYEIGTSVIIKGISNVDYILLAISEFNQYNNAKSTKNQLIQSVKRLVNFVNCHCQGYECYVPLMGTGLSRSNLDHKKSLHTIVSTMDLYNEDVISPINVVIYNGDKSKVSIYDY